jgi:UDP-2-acetamido-2-deoxy-ribo-hexuluronate aminotransferase
VQVAKRVLSLPMSADLSAADQDRVVAALVAAGHPARIAAE